MLQVCNQTVGRVVRRGRDTGCTIVIVHHNRKAPKENQFGPPDLESIAWFGFQEWARQWILLGRREAYSPELSGSHRLWLSVGGSAGHSGLWGLDVEVGSRKDTGGRRWEVSIDGASAVVAENIAQNESAKEERARLKEEKKFAKDAERLIVEYRKTLDGDTATSFVARAGMNPAPGRRATAWLLSEGKIEECEVTKGNGQTYSGYRLLRTVDQTTPTHSDTLRHHSDEIVLSECRTA